MCESIRKIPKTINYIFSGKAKEDFKSLIKSNKVGDYPKSKETHQRIQQNLGILYNALGSFNVLKFLWYR